MAASRAPTEQHEALRTVLNRTPPPTQPISSTMLLSTALSHAASLALVLCVRRVRALTNVTIDDQSPLISYAPAGSWARINDSTTATLDVDGGHMLTSDPTATAVLNFTGVAVYFLSARWPYNVSSAVALDDGPAVLLDLTDHTRAVTDGGPATVKAAIVGQAVGLLNVTHTLTVSVGAGQPFAVVDAIMCVAMSSSTWLF
ncbi:hypothetical protein HYPSUDRAFT_289840 [Hypholoma sublateritium FD-334 SS-4]|uniref:Transmembrane protein n=1 Tax=Hypholoma sublateritium (strain FD-334 SS-4) TaxID=945553 RepID=A0A0D2M037_HYPSF|nr:hypothetical protein HYPSUDRAFT_289840 [Hypholoma sublateritium FD-334 SS-4]